MMKKNELNIDLIKKGLEELKTIRINRVSEACVKGSSKRLCENKIKSKGGVYAIWWTGDQTFFRKNICKDVTFPGPGGVKIKIHYTTDWLDRLQHQNICLYIGKNRENIRKRLTNHFKLSSLDFEKNQSPFGRRFRKLFSKISNNSKEFDYKKLILENIGISFFEMDGDFNSVNRFYLEDKAIGELYPILNIDIER